MAFVAVLFIAAQLVLILRVPVPSILPWSVVAIVGTATVVSFAAIVDYFPPELTGRANGALNVLHFGWAFLAQYGTGVVLQQWSIDDGHRSIAAYQVAFGLNVALQIAAMAWFALPGLESFTVPMVSIPSIMPIGAFDPVEAGIFCEQADDDAEW